MAFSVIYQGARAMATDIVKRANRAIFATRGHDRIPSEARCHIVTWALQLAFMCEQLPSSGKNFPPLGLVNCRVAVESRGQSVWGWLAHALS
jgi:hypothetical protein